MSHSFFHRSTTDLIDPGKKSVQIVVPRMRRIPGRAADIARIIRNAGKTAVLITHDLSEAISLSDRVIVLSKRPATVKGIFPIRLTLPDDSLLAARKAPEYSEYFNQIWEELSDETQ